MKKDFIIEMMRSLTNEMIMRRLRMVIIMTMVKM
jgi:hypothetical protein